MRHRILQTTSMLTLMLSLLLHASWCFAEKKPEQPKQALSQLQKQLEELKKDLDQAQEEHKDAADALKESEVAISSANKKLHEISKQQIDNKKELAKLEAESKSTNIALNQQQKLLSGQLYQQYIHGQQSYVQMILQSQRPSEVARDLHYYSYVAKARADLINNMQNNLNKITKLNELTASKLQEITDLKQKQIDEKRILELKKKEKSKVVKSLSQQIAEQRGQIKKLSRDEKRLSQLVSRLAQIIPKKKKVAKQSSQTIKPTPNTAVNNEKLPSDNFIGANFQALKGKLRLPVRGEVSNRFGSIRQDSGISWKGLFIKANEGAEVKAVASGRVVFADWLRGFGNLIILDHGDGYMSLYGNNQSVLRQPGDMVKGGDTIASVGNTGGNESNGLYYELRNQSRPFDPMAWSNLN
ncbi:murein hydrolase activator EnvC family protein [Methylotenera sp. L2L1]|uniref:murein hydrolase activator EnvC family protein n=1 Tax=Methylotenera sp. L2L1 TaxID=1502770 RepID=UPI00055B6866|nr:peptidoglycan DD-metalloendopeptidase family protein [Methylotenera sp. L2L1]